MTFAPPVSRGNFHYNGNLYLEVGNCNRHERATIEEITTILRPDLKKSKKVSLDQSKDQVGHWYEAQLIHYGLPPSKDKARAKMRLLEALNQSKLTVPPDIVRMEAEMKKEYAAAERKAKAQYKAGMAPPTKGEAPVAGKKRKQSDPSANINSINVSISLGNDFQGFPSAVNATNNQPPAKKAKTAASKPTTKKTESTASSKPSKKPTKGEIEQSSSQAPNRPKQTARCPAKEPTAKKPSRAKPKPKTEGATPLKKEAKPKKEPKVKNESPAKNPSGAKSKAKPKAEGATTPVKKEAGAQKEAKPKKEPKVKNESPAKPPSSKIKPEPGTDSSPRVPKPSSSSSSPLGLINGIYDLSCPTVEREWSCHDLTLVLSLDGTSVWGAYDLDAFTGIIFLPHRPWQASSTVSHEFTWRGRETGEGEMSFGDGCEGGISFLGNGRIEGWIGVYGRCEFEGVRRVEGGTMVRSSRSMRDEWEGYNAEAYEEESIARW